MLLRSTAEREQLLEGMANRGHNEAQWNPSVASDNEDFRFDVCLLLCRNCVDDICATRADTIYVVQHRGLHLSPPADVQALKYSAQFVCMYRELCTVQRMPTTCTFSHLLLCVLLSAAVKPQRLQRFS